VDDREGRREVSGDRATLASYQIVILGRMPRSSSATRPSRGSRSGSIATTVRWFCFRGAPSLKDQPALGRTAAGPLDAVGRDPLPCPVDRRRTGLRWLRARARPIANRDARPGHDRPAQGQALRGDRLGHQRRVPARGWRVDTAVPLVTLLGRPEVSAVVAWWPWRGPVCGDGPSCRRSIRIATNFMVRCGGA